jgi:hypothetical protein
MAEHEHIFRLLASRSVPLGCARNSSCTA